MRPDCSGPVATQDPACDAILPSVGLENTILAVSGVISLARVAFAASAAPEVAEAFHYTYSKYLESITRNGLRQGTYATPSGTLSPLQAQIELALPANRGLPDALIRIDVDRLRWAGYEIPGVSRVSSGFKMPGGGYEMQFPYEVPPEFITVAPR